MKTGEHTECILAVIPNVGKVLSQRRQPDARHLLPANQLELLSPPCENNIPEYARAIWISGASRPQHSRQISRYSTIDCIHLLYRRLATTSDKNVAEHRKESQ